MDGKGYATRDLFVPHPSKPGMWKTYVVVPPRTFAFILLSYRVHSTGRQDDVIVLGSGMLCNMSPQTNGLDLYFTRREGRAAPPGRRSSCECDSAADIGCHVRPWKESMRSPPGDSSWTRRRRS